MHQTKATEWQGTKEESVLYMAMDVGKSIKVAFSPTGLRPRMMDVPGKDWRQLLLEVEQAKVRFGLPTDCSVISCHEAGRGGFWLHRALEAHGVVSILVDSSSIEVKRKKRRVKTDRLDAQSLLRLLARHHLGEPDVWSIVRVPDLKAEDERRLLRERRRLKKDETQHRNRIRGLLATKGLEAGSLKRAFEEFIHTARQWDGSTLLPSLSRELLRQYQRLSLVWEQMREVDAEMESLVKGRKCEGDPISQKLYRLRGVGTVSSFGLSKEIFSWRVFRNGKQLAGLVGLVPTPYISGDSQKEQGISKSGSGYLRSLMVELAWSWLRFQPDSGLSQWFWERFGHGNRRNRKVGIVALARKLLVALWHWVEHDRLPEGAVLMK